MLGFRLGLSLHCKSRRKKAGEKDHKTEEAINNHWSVDNAWSACLVSSESKESESLTNILDSSRDLERIGIRRCNPAWRTLIQEKIALFSDNALAGVEDIYQQTATLVKDALRDVEEDNQSWQQSWRYSHQGGESSKRNCGRPGSLASKQGRVAHLKQVSAFYWYDLSLYTCTQTLCHEFSRRYN